MAQRRQIVLGGAAVGVAAALSLWPHRAVGEKEEEISPVEDLMREHGVLRRVLLVYEASLDRLAKGDASPLPTVVKAADIVRHFIEDYHEKLEEEFLFPRFEKAGKHADLVQTLRTQHQRGRALTDVLRQLAQGGAATDDERSRLRDNIQAFIRMYRPHAAREDTVLFPAFGQLVSEKEYDKLGDQFEDREHQLFGAAGFFGVVDQVAELEKALDIYDLNRVTPAQ